MVISLLLAIGMYVIPLNEANFKVQVLIANLIGYNLFVVLAYIGQKINNYRVQKVFSKIGKYSYAIFLVHHYIIMKIESTFVNSDFKLAGTILLYITCWIVIAICAKLLYLVNRKFLDLLKEDKETKLIKAKK